MICYHFASPFSHWPQLADFLALQDLYYVVAEQLQLQIEAKSLRSSNLCLQRMGKTAAVSIPKIKYNGFTSKTLVSN